MPSWYNNDGQYDDPRSVNPSYEDTLGGALNPSYSMHAKIRKKSRQKHDEGISDYTNFNEFIRLARQLNNEGVRLDPGLTPQAVASFGDLGQLKKLLPQLNQLTGRGDPGTEAIALDYINKFNYGRYTSGGQSVGGVSYRAPGPLLAELSRRSYDTYYSHFYDNDGNAKLGRTGGLNRDEMGRIIAMMGERGAFNSSNAFTTKHVTSEQELLKLRDEAVNRGNVLEASELTKKLMTFTGNAYVTQGNKEVQDNQMKSIEQMARGMENMKDVFGENAPMSMMISALEELGGLDWSKGVAGIKKAQSNFKHMVNTLEGLGVEDVSGYVTQGLTLQEKVQNSAARYLGHQSTDAIADILRQGNAQNMIDAKMAEQASHYMNTVTGKGKGTSALDYLAKKTEQDVESVKRSENSLLAAVLGDDKTSPIADEGKRKRFRNKATSILKDVAEGNLSEAEGQNMLGSLIRETTGMSLEEATAHLGGKENVAKVGASTDLGKSFIDVQKNKVRANVSKDLVKWQNKINPEAMKGYSTAEQRALSDISIEKLGRKGIGGLLDAMKNGSQEDINDIFNRAGLSSSERGLISKTLRLNPKILEAAGEYIGQAEARGVITGPSALEKKDAEKEAFANAVEKFKVNFQRNTSKGLIGDFFDGLINGEDPLNTAQRQKLLNNVGVAMQNIGTMDRNSISLDQNAIKGMMNEADYNDLVKTYGKDFNSLSNEKKLALVEDLKTKTGVRLDERGKLEMFNQNTWEMGDDTIREAAKAKTLAEVASRTREDFNGVSASIFGRFTNEEGRKMWEDADKRFSNFNINGKKMSLSEINYGLASGDEEIMTSLSKNKSEMKKYKQAMNTIRKEKLMAGGDIFSFNANNVKDLKWGNDQAMSLDEIQAFSVAEIDDMISAANDPKSRKALKEKMIKQDNELAAQQKLASDEDAAKIQALRNALEEGMTKLQEKTATFEQAVFNGAVIEAKEVKTPA